MEKTLRFQRKKEKRGIVGHRSDVVGVVPCECFGIVALDQSVKRVRRTDPEQQSRSIHTGLRLQRHSGDRQCPVFLFYAETEASSPFDLKHECDGLEGELGSGGAGGVAGGFYACWGVGCWLFLSRAAGDTATITSRHMCSFL